MSDKIEKLEFATTLLSRMEDVSNVLVKIGERFINLNREMIVLSDDVRQIRAQLAGMCEDINEYVNGENKNETRGS